MVNETKIYVKKVIWNFETNRWKSSCMLYRELKLYMDGVMAIRMNVWWLLAKKRPHLTGKISSVIAVLMSCQPKSLQCNHGHKLCRLCQITVVENPVHTLFHCNRLGTVRTPLLENIIKDMPAPMADCVLKMNDADKFIFFISGLKCELFIDEWEQILIQICNFVHEIYVHRKSEYSLMDS